MSIQVPLAVPPRAKSSHVYLMIFWLSVKPLTSHVCGELESHEPPPFSDLVGNHELYDLPIAQDMHDNFAPT
jgi:hypothetical protein